MASFFLPPPAPRPPDRSAREQHRWRLQLPASLQDQYLADTFAINAVQLFLLLNVASNAVMWVLFTRALAAAASTTQVAILNTASNFFVTALLGVAVFSEALAATWWAGAALLVAGSVIIGRREEGQAPPRKADGSSARQSGRGRDGVTEGIDLEFRDEEEGAEENRKRYRDADEDSWGEEEESGGDAVEKERLRREKEERDAWRR